MLFSVAGGSPRWRAVRVRPVPASCDQVSVPCNTDRVIRIAQLSDTHFLEDGEEPEGGFAYNTAEAFDAVRDHIHARPRQDLVVVTGDIADHGRMAQYRRAAAAFSQLDAPINVCPGNHDQHATFTVGMGRPTIGTSRVIEVDNWCFLFVDSNAGVMVPDETGRMVDPTEYDDRLHRSGALGDRESSWVRDMHDATDADHVFLWLHHPPAATGLSRDDRYTDEWRALLPELAKVRGMGGGHTHVPAQYDFLGCPIFVSPAFKNNFDLDGGTTLPPGYRTFEFMADGSITGDVQLVDDARWPRQRLGRAVISLMQGELSWDDFNAIVARKNAAS